MGFMMFYSVVFAFAKKLEFLRPFTFLKIFASQVDVRIGYYTSVYGLGRHPGDTQAEGWLASGLACQRFGGVNLLI